MDAPVAYITPPATLVNEALDRIGASDRIIGDISDGGPIAESARRNYGQLLRKLFRVAHWNWCRAQAPLTLLADATGQTPNVSTTVDVPWTYAYAWPIDGVSVRWMPEISPQQQINPPLTTGQFLPQSVPNMPGRFLVSSSNLYPVEVGTLPWDQQPDLQRTFGVGPVNRTIILTNTCNAIMVYTRFIPTIEEWDASFREAFVCMLAMALCPVAIDDRKERIAQRDKMYTIAKIIIDDARVANGNESGFPVSVDHLPPWITARNTGWYGFGGSGNLGGFSGYQYFPWDGSMQWCGSVF
jgi:hypothetical protein